jgi:hypothetical protein
MEPTPGLEPGTARLQGKQLVPSGLSMPRNTGLNAVIAGNHGCSQQEFMDKLMDSQSAWTIAPPSSRASRPTRARVEQAVLAPPQKDSDLPLAVGEIAASPFPVTLFTQSAMGARSGGKVARPTPPSPTTACVRVPRGQGGRRCAARARHGSSAVGATQRASPAPASPSRVAVDVVCVEFGLLGVDAGYRYDLGVWMEGGI